MNLTQPASEPCVPLTADRYAWITDRRPPNDQTWIVFEYGDHFKVGYSCGLGMDNQDARRWFAFPTTARVEREQQHPDTARLDWLQENYFRARDDVDTATSIAWVFYTPKADDAGTTIRRRLDAAIARQNAPEEGRS